MTAITISLGLVDSYRRKLDGVGIPVSLDCPGTNRIFSYGELPASTPEEIGSCISSISRSNEHEEDHQSQDQVGSGPASRYA